MRLPILGFSALVLGTVLVVPAAGACPGETVVMGAGRAFTVASRNGSPTAFLNAASRFADMRAIAMSALGPHRKKLTRAQEDEYVRLARLFMGRFMARHAGYFNASGMRVVSCSGSTITATANGGRKIIFRVAGGRVRDVNVSSIWLASQMRSKFVSVINRNNGSVQALFDYLRG